MNERPALSFAAARVTRAAGVALIAQARQAAEAEGLCISVAVVDATGTLCAFERDDNAPFFTAEVAIRKAWTAASSGLPTHVWNSFVAQPAMAPMMQLPQMMPVAGGLPLIVDGKLVGGLGVSGGPPEQDCAIAEAALNNAGFAAE